MGKSHVTTLRVTICMIAALLFLLMATATNVAAGEPAAQPASDDNALQLLAIELFFLLVGLFVIVVLGYLIWESWRKKKEKGKTGK
jgi:heme/copper-type cytochrome/quinol oxidase subunit 2